MSDPNDAWTAPSGDNDRDRSPRRDDRDGRSPPPPRNRSRSPGARNGGGGGGGDRGREPDVSNQGNNLHVSGLSKSIDQQYLEELFGKHGKVDSCQLMVDPHTQESRGFGFVKMETSDQANAVIDAINGQNIEGKTVTVAHARRGRARTPTPGRYHGVKVEFGGPRGGGGYGGGSYDYRDRPYQPRSYDSRYSDRGLPPRSYDDRPPRYDDRRYDDRRDYYDRRDYRDRRYDDREPRGPPPDRSDRGAERGGDRGGYDRRDERPRYEERPRY